MRTAGRAWSTPARHENTRRRLAPVISASLVLLSTSLVFGHHLPLKTRAFGGAEHLGALCVTALHLLFAPVQGAAHAVIAAGFLYAAWDRARAWRKVRRILGPLDAPAPAADSPFRLAAVEAGLDPRRVRVVAGLPNPAFTAGFSSPRVYVDEALAGSLSREELVAVLAHERVHVERRDPLRLSLLRALARTLFWLPAVRRLAADVTEDAELLADDAASGDRPLVLASAILKLTHWPSQSPDSPADPAAAVGFDKPDLLDRRIRRLVGEESPVQSHVTRRSLVGAAAALALVWVSGLLVGSPLPASTALASDRHCRHRHESVIRHLFCFGTVRVTPPPHCPHQDAAT